MATAEMMAEWFEDEIAIDKTTLTQFDQYVEEWAKEKEIAETLKDELTERNKKLSKMQAKLIEFLEAQGKDAHETRIGKIKCVTKETWKAPEGPERENVIEYLKEKGLYDAVTAFNASKFHAWYNNERDASPGFDLPGVAQDSIRYIKFTARKG